MNTAMKNIFAIATMLAHVAAFAESYRLLAASDANSSCVGFGLVLVEQHQRNRCVDSDRAIPAVPNPENASTAAVISAEILPMDFNDTAGKSIKKNKVRVRDQMFRQISFCFSPILNTAFSSPPKEFFHPNEGSLSTASAHSVMEVLSFMDESRKRIRAVQQSAAEVMFPTCTWESAINVSF
jgi:hypothetical protein